MSDDNEKETELEKAEREYREAVEKDKKAQEEDPKKRWGKD